MKPCHLMRSGQLPKSILEALADWFKVFCMPARLTLTPSELTSSSRNSPAIWIILHFSKFLCVFFKPRLSSRRYYWGSKTVPSLQGPCAQHSFLRSKGGLDCLLGVPPLANLVTIPPISDDCDSMHQRVFYLLQWWIKKAVFSPLISIKVGF